MSNQKSTYTEPLTYENKAIAVTSIPPNNALQQLMKAMKIARQKQLMSEVYQLFLSYLKNNQDLAVLTQRTSDNQRFMYITLCSNECSITVRLDGGRKWLRMIVSTPSHNQSIAYGKLPAEQEEYEELLWLVQHDLQATMATLFGLGDEDDWEMYRCCAEVDNDSFPPVLPVALKDFLAAVKKDKRSR